MEKFKTTVWTSWKALQKEVYNQNTWKELTNSLSTIKDRPTSQIIPWKYSQELLKDFPKIEKFEDFETLHKLLRNHLNFIQIETEEQKQKEKDIRWKRTWEEIIQQKDVYRGKACTDVTIAYMTLLQALGIEASFVKVKNKKNIHSILEIFFNGEYYIFDVADYKLKYTKASFKKGEQFWDRIFWGKGKDSRDLWLKKCWDTIQD